MVASLIFSSGSLAHASDAPLMRACTAACERMNMMRAVGAEVIARQCESSCRDELASPSVERASDLKGLTDKRVRATGKLIPPKDAGAASGSLAVIRLDDGTDLSLDSGPALDPVQLEAFSRRVVVAVGTLRPGPPPQANHEPKGKRKLVAHLDHVTFVGVAPDGP